MKALSPRQARTWALGVIFAMMLAGVASSAASSAWGQSPSRAPSFTESYNAYVGGFHAFDFSLHLEDDATGYRADLVLEARGLLKRLKDLKAWVTAKGVWLDVRRIGVEPLASVRPESYVQRYWRADKPGLREVRYDAETRLAHGYRNGKEETKVPEGLRRGVLDPLATLVIGRRLLAEIKPGETRSLPVFDGRLRYDFKATVEEPRTLTIGEARVRVLPIRMQPIPRAGFSDEQLRNWQGRVVQLYFSDDEKRVPLKAVVETAFGAFVATRQGSCDEVVCLQPLKDYQTGQ